MTTRAEADRLMAEAPTKIARVMTHMLLIGSLNRFEAERIGDHCLHSTISKLANNYGLNFRRINEKVPNGWGAPCEVTRYSLPGSERRRATLALEMMTRRNKIAA